MIAIEELPDGVYLIDTKEGKRFSVSLDDLSEDTRDKLDMLRAADLHTRIEKVGTRLSETLYWIAEEGDNDDFKPTAELRLYIEAAVNFIRSSLIYDKDRISFRIAVLIYKPLTRSSKNGNQ